MRKTNGEPYTGRLVRTVRGQALGNLSSQDGKAPGAEPTIWIGASAGFRQDFRLRKSGEKCTVFGLANSFRKFVVTSNDK